MITAKQVMELREKTGVPMMSCKKALENTEGDIDKAIEILRKEGEMKADDVKDRETREGIIAAAKEEGKAAMVKLLCETDFVAKNNDFISLAKKTVDRALKDEINKKDIDEDIKNLFIKLKENMTLAENVVIKGNNLGVYVHNNNRVGVIVSLEGGDSELAQDIAMHIAAMDPKYIKPEDVSQENVNKEKEIWSDQLKREGKPEEIIPKIMIGKEKKFREDHALLTQTFVKDDQKQVKDILGSEVEVKEFRRMAV